MFTESLTPRPELENDQDPMWTLLAIAAAILIAFGLLARRHEVRTRKAFETSLTGSEPEQFRGVRMVAPWRKVSGSRQRAL
jgi:hypothetical protein